MSNKQHSVRIRGKIVTYSPHGTCIRIGKWKSSEIVKWKGEPVRISFLFVDGSKFRAAISNMNMPFCGCINETVPLSELKKA